jgi:hypothetical protein
VIVTNIKNGVVISVISKNPVCQKKLKSKGAGKSQEGNPSGVKGSVMQVRKLDDGIEMTITAESEDSIKEVQKYGEKLLKGDDYVPQKKGMTQQPVIPPPVQNKPK